MNRKGQLGILSFIFALGVFIVLWALFFASWLGDWAENFIVSQSLTGLEAFLVANINLWVFFGVLIGVFVAVYGGSR